MRAPDGCRAQRRQKDRFFGRQGLTSVLQKTPAGPGSCERLQNDQGFFGCALRNVRSTDADAPCPRLRGLQGCFRAPGFSRIRRLCEGSSCRRRQNGCEGRAVCAAPRALPIAPRFSSGEANTIRAPFLLFPAARRRSRTGGARPELFRAIKKTAAAGAARMRSSVVLQAFTTVSARARSKGRPRERRLQATECEN